MAKNLNTLPSANSNKFSIRWLKFSPTKENEINAKKLKIGKDGYVPKLNGEAKDTYIIKQNDVWCRCVRESNKLKKIPGATIKSDEKIKNCKERMSQKYDKNKQKNSYYR